MTPGAYHVRQPMPSARGIRWTPVRPRPRSVTNDGYAIFVTQSALRDIAEHAWMAPEQELLGFLLGWLGESPETGERYTVISSAMRTEYAIPEDAAIQIPEEVWHAVHLEARLRRATLLGWYHSSPYLGDVPSLVDRETHRRQFPEPWMAGLVVVPSADRPDGGFFRADGSPADPAAGMFLPFYELLDEDAQPIGGRKPTVVGWESYRTDDPVVRPVSRAAAGVAGLGTRVGTRDSGLGTGEVAGSRGASGGAAMGAPVGSPLGAPAGAAFGAPDALGTAFGTQVGAPGTPRMSGTPAPFPVLFPPEAYEQAPDKRGVGRGGSAQRVAFFAGAAALVAASILAVATLARWAPSSEPSDAPIPVRSVERRPPAVTPPADDPATIDPAATDPLSTGPAATDPTAAGPTAAGPEVTNPAAAGPTVTGSATERPAPPATTPAGPTTRPAGPNFERMVTALEAAIRNYYDRRTDFSLGRLDCDGLARGYRAADDAFIAMAQVYGDVGAGLSVDQALRYQKLSTAMNAVNADFDESRCPRP